MEPIEFAERVTLKIDGIIIESEKVPYEEAKDDPSCMNICGHIGVRFEDCWPYTIVKCAVCDRGLGLS